MSLLGLLVLGVILGAAGTEVLRAKNPELLEKIENKAKGLVDKLGMSKASEDDNE